MAQVARAGEKPEGDTGIALFCDVLEYALGCSVPASFAAGLLERRAAWDEEFTQMIHSTAYEFRSELCIWEMGVDAKGQLLERRVPLYELLASG